MLRELLALRNEIKRTVTDLDRVIVSCKSDVVNLHYTTEKQCIGWQLFESDIKVPNIVKFMQEARKTVESSKWALNFSLTKEFTPLYQTMLKCKLANHNVVYTVELYTSSIENANAVSNKYQSDMLLKMKEIVSAIESKYVS